MPGPRSQASRNAQAATALARILIGRGEHEEALQLLEPLPHDFTAAGLAARAWLSNEGPDLDDA